MSKTFNYDAASASPVTYDAATQIYTIKHQGQEVKLAPRDLNSLVHHLYLGDQSVIVVGEEAWSQDLYGLDRALREGTRLQSAEALVGLNTDVMPAMGVVFYPNTDLSGMPKREHIGAAGYSVAAALRRFRGSFRFFEVPVAELERAAEHATYLAVLRDGFFSLERTLGANELKVVPGLRQWIVDAVNDLGDKVRSIPLLGQAMSAALDYATGSINQAAESNRRARAKRAEDTKKIEEEVTAKAREEGRAEATKQMKDRIIGSGEK